MDDEDEVVKNVTQKKEKKIKEEKSNKGEKNEERLMGIHEECYNINDVDAIEHVQVSGKYEVAEIKRDSKQDKVKKSKKRTYSMADAKQGTEEGELLTVAYGEKDGSGGTMDNIERKRKKRGEDKTNNTIEVEGDENNKKTLDEIGNKEVKKQKVKRKRKNGDFEETEKEFGQNSQNCKSRERKKEKKMNKHDNSEAKHDGGDSSLLLDNVEESAKHDENATKKLERKKKNMKKKKKKKKKKNKRDDSSSGEKDNVDHDNNGVIQSDEVEYANKEKKKKKKNHTQLMGNGFDNFQEYVVECEKKENKKKTKSNDATPIKNKKKVRFSNEDEFFPIPGGSNTKKVNDGEENLVRGKRFTPEEDEIIRDAVFHYIERHALGNGGEDMVLNCKKYPELKGCWKEIASAIPHRPYRSVYYRAQKLFFMGDNRKYTQEEYDKIMKYQAEHGCTKWRTLADQLGKFTVHVANTWRRIKLSTRKKGRWSQDEYQKLFELVNVDLQAKIYKAKISRYGMLRDNIGWTAISDVLLTRLQKDCCKKWYGQLTSRMVAEGEWADSDDYRLIGALYSLDATCMEDVEWDGLVEGRTGDVCRKRWGQMVLHIGKHGHKSFAEQVEVLGQRYCPNMLEAREIWDSKPRVS